MQRLIIYFCLFSLILSSCTNSEEYRNIKLDFADVSYNDKYHNFDSIYSKIPSYYEISKTINSFSTKYKSNLLLDIDNLELFDNSKTLTLLLGMHIADLGYARHFERVEKCKEILISINTLSEKLAISRKELDNNIMILEDNLYEREFVFDYIDSLISSKDNILNNNEKYSISALVLSGFWVESTYIGLSICKLEDNNKPNNDNLTSHFEILRQINILLDCLDDNNTLRKLKSDLKKIEIEGYKSKKTLFIISSLRKSLTQTN